MAGLLFDSASSKNSGPGVVGSLTWAHTITAAGTGRLLTVGVSIRMWAAENVTSVTFDGVALTKIEDEDSVTPKIRGELWRLKSPPTGTHNIIVTLSAAARFCGGGISFTGVDQVDTFGTAVKANGDGLLATVNAASSAEQLVVDVCAWHDTDHPMIVGANQTERYVNETTAAATTNDAAIGGSTEPGAGATTMSWSRIGLDKEWAIIAVPIKPATPLRTRLIKYFTNSYDPKKRIIDVLGRSVPPEQVEVGVWTRSEGPYLITPKKHASLIQEPSVAFNESLHYGAKGDKLSIESVTETQLESLLRRLA